MDEKYENIVNSLRYCAENDCSPKCPRAGIGKGCISGLKQAAADAIEELSKRVPSVPHGRLIDADALIDDLKRQCKEVFRIDAVSPEDFWINRNEAYRQRLYESWCEGFYEYVGSRPTIIPAEEDK